MKIYKAPHPHFAPRPSHFSRTAGEAAAKQRRYQLAKRRRLLLEGSSSCVTQPSDEQIWALLHFDGANLDTTTVDSGYRQHVVTIAGTGAKLSSTQTKFGTTSFFTDESVGFTNTTRAYWPPDTVALNMTADSEITIEAWIYMVDVPSTTGDEECIVSWYKANNNNRSIAFQVSADDRLFASIDAVGDDSTNFVTVTADAGTELSAGQWYHVAFTRDSSGVGRLWLDGTKVGEQTGMNIAPYAADANWFVGCVESTIATNYLNRFDGYIDDVRICLDHCVYTCDFDVPTEAHADPTVTPESATYDPYWDRVFLLLHFDGVNLDTTTVDSSANAHTIGSSGSTPPTLSTDVSKFGTTVCKNLSTSSYAWWDCADNVSGKEFEIRGQTFTMECWVYFPTATGIPSTLGDTCTMMGQYRNGSNRRCFVFDFLVDDKMRFGYSEDGSAFTSVIADSAGISVDTWHHCAVTKAVDGTVQLWLDGVAQLASPPKWTGSMYVPADDALSQEIYIAGGIYGIVPDNFFVGYMDEARITIGAARYDDTFTPPTFKFYDE